MKKRALSNDLWCAAAVLRYFQVPYSDRSLLDYLHKHRFGSLITELAECLTCHGLQVTLVSANPSLFSRNAWEQFALVAKPSDNQASLHVEHVRQVIKLGVLVKGRVPTQELIDAELAKNRPVLISCNINVLRQVSGIESDFAVITESDDKSFTLVEANAQRRKHKYSKTIVMYAIHSNVTENPTSGSILLMKARRK